MTRALQLSDSLSLPLRAVTEKLAFLGRTGSGKTYAAQKLAEEMHAAAAQFVVLDPVGVWYGLRLAADGKAPGLPVPVLGGLHGDIPLEPGAGALIANLVVDRGVSMVLDVSQFESDADKARFARAFADRFFFRMKAAPSAVHLFLEECQEFAPQNPQREEAGMLHAFTRLVKIGRNYGIGVSLISQRPQEVNKKVLNLTELLFAFQLTGPQERKTLQGWIAEKGIDEDIAGELPKLKVGAPHVWSPAWLQISKVVPIARKSTYDASSTPTVGTKAATRALSPIDLERLRTDMAATIEKAKAEDPRELRRRIAELEAEARKKPAHNMTAKVPIPPAPKRVEVPILTDGQIKRLERVMTPLQTVAGRFEALHAEAVAVVRAMNESIRERIRAAIPPEPIPGRPIPGQVSRRTEAVRQQQRAGTGKVTAIMVSRTSVPLDAPPVLGKAERAVLTVLAQHPDGCESGQLALLAGYRWSGGFRNSLSALRTSQYLAGENSAVMRITDEGLAALGDYDPLPIGRALIDYWLRHPSFGKCERAILEALVAVHPKGLRAEELAARTGYEWSGGFRNSLSALRTAGLLVGKNSDEMRASDTLF